MLIKGLTDIKEKKNPDYKKFYFKTLSSFKLVNLTSKDSDSFIKKVEKRFLKKDARMMKRLSRLCLLDDTFNIFY